MQAWFVPKEYLKEVGIITPYHADEKVYKAADVEARIKWLEEGEPLLRAILSLPYFYAVYVDNRKAVDDWLAREPKEGG